jgi:hypothetical protein
VRRVVTAGGRGRSTRPAGNASLGPGCGRLGQQSCSCPPSRVCYNLHRRTLQAAAPSATSGDSYCYRRRLRLLQAAAAFATGGGAFCYKRPWRLLQTSTHKLQAAVEASDDATSVRRGCYQSLLPVLRLACDAATKAQRVARLASTGDQRCSDGRPSMLQGRPRCSDWLPLMLPSFAGGAWRKNWLRRLKDRLVAACSIGGGSMSSCVLERCRRHQFLWIEDEETGAFLFLLGRGRVHHVGEEVRCVHTGGSCRSACIGRLRTRGIRDLIPRETLSAVLQQKLCTG